MTPEQIELRAAIAAYAGAADIVAKVTWLRVERCIDALVQAERERCAKVVEAIGATAREKHPYPGPQWMLDVVDAALQATCEGAAKLIRTGLGPPDKA